MRKMKPSGVEWIGDIPQEWEIALIKYSIKWKSEKGKPDATVLSLYRDYGIVPKDSRDDNHNVTSLDTSGYKVVDIGDFVINKMKAWQGSMAISSYKGIVSPAYHVCEITDDKVYRNYFHYLLRSDLYITEYTRLSKGMRIGQWDLDFHDFKNLPFLIPPISEQQRIAEFLDRKCAEIDSIIAKTKATIEEYKALKQAVITQAVTKGIRPDRPMKDSGIEWIGEIPQEWEIRKLFRAIDKIGDIDHYMPESVDNGIPYLMTGDLLPLTSNIDFDTCKQISIEDYDRLSSKIKPETGDVIFARYATIGTVCYVDVNDSFLVSYSCLTIKPIKRILNGKFLFYYLKSQTFFEDVQQYIKSNTQSNVGLDSMSKVKIILPSMSEQQEIADYLDRKCAEIDSLIAAKEQLLTELESYKKSVIYEYVTGKKEI